MGTGPSLGWSIAKKFLQKNFIVVVCRRNKDKFDEIKDQIQKQYLDRLHLMKCDARDRCFIHWYKHKDVLPTHPGAKIQSGVQLPWRQIKDQYRQVQEAVVYAENLGPIEAAIFNIGANVRFSVQDTSERVFFKVWQMACFAGFIFGKEVSKVMIQRNRGFIAFTGASASLRGKENFSAFAAAKSGLRSFAQSLAKELMPIGIHVSHIVIDGPIDSPFIRNIMQNQIEFDIQQEQLLKPDEIAQNYWHLYQQDKSAWTFEMDLRSFREKW